MLLTVDVDVCDREGEIAELQDLIDPAGRPIRR
jgi:hypothetical protein